MNSKLKTYSGIIDAHGLESIKEKTKEDMNFLYLRASLNRQRHATYFEIDVEPLVAANICQSDSIQAWKMIKNQPTFRVSEDMSKSVELIPKPDLDPWKKPIEGTNEAMKSKGMFKD